jgi:6-phosphogluconolactonase
MVYVGTYTQGKSKGIYQFRMDPVSGQLTPAGLAAETVNPSFLAIAPDHRFLYAVNEIGDFEGTDCGAVSAFAIDPKNGKLTFLNQQSSRGSAPCHLIVDRHGKNVLVANYGGGSMAVLPIAPDGRLAAASAFVQHHGSSINPRRQKEPHAHSINLDAANRYAFAADLGLDKVLIYRFDAAQGTLIPHDPPSASIAPGSGPRHFAFHPNGRSAYVINEINSSVTALGFDANSGALTLLQMVSTLPEGFTGNNSTAEIQVHPSGRFLYGSNRGDNSIAIFAIDADTGKLTGIGHEPTQGKTPRGFRIDPTGHFLLTANQDARPCTPLGVPDRRSA